MSTEKSRNAKMVLERLRTECKLNSDKELAAFLEVKQNTISTWRARNSVNCEKIIAKCEGKDLIFIFYGYRGSGIDSNQAALLQVIEEFKYEDPERLKLALELVERLVQLQPAYINAANQTPDPAIAARLAMIQEKSCLDDDEFALVGNVPVETWRRYKSGQWIPCGRFIYDICFEFGYSQRWVYSGEGEPLSDEIRLIELLRSRGISKQEDFERKVIIKSPELAPAG
ncbi:MAG: hypothetical protein D6712_20960 [Chloroflexi bacterium]|nr:MAG: hypothetical protein D6712_20960 [Chloroflexota bacterium]